MQHAVTHKAVAVAHQYADFLDGLGNGHGSGFHFVRGLLATNDFQQFHDVGRAEEMQANHVFRALGGRGDFVNVQGGGVGGQNRTGLTDVVELLEDALLDVHVLEHGLNDQIHILERVVIQSGGNQSHPLFNLLLGHATFLGSTFIVATDDAKALVQSFLLHFGNDNGDAHVGEVHGNTATHGARTNNAHFLDVTDGGVFRQTRNLGHFALGEERVNQAGTLVRLHQFAEQFALTLHASLEGLAGEGGFDGIHALERCNQTTGGLLETGAELIEYVAALLGFNLVGQLADAAGRFAFINHFLGEGQACGLDVFVLGHFVNNAQFGGFSGANKVTGGDHFQGFLGAGQTR